jgi:hypothetical protein
MCCGHEAFSALHSPKVNAAFIVKPGTTRDFHPAEGWLAAVENLLISESRAVVLISSLSSCSRSA